MTRLCTTVFALAGCALLPAQVTTISTNNTVLQSTVRRFGINLGQQNYYDSGQMLKNLVYINPSFEGEIFQSAISCATGTATSCTDTSAYSSWPAGYWVGATYTFIYGSALGRTGTITNYTASNGTIGGVFTLSNSGVAPSSGDYMIVSRKVPGNPGAGWWVNTTGAGSLTANTTDFPAGNTGTQTAFINAPTASDAVTVASYFDTTVGRSFVQLNGQYQLTFMAKGLSGSQALTVSLVRETSPQLNYLYQEVNLTNGWAEYTLNFNASENGTAVGPVQLAFSTVGADSLYLDQVSLVQLNTDPTNTTVFRDPVVNALKALQPGVMRWWFNQLGETLDNMLADPMGRQRSAYSPYAGDTTYVEYGLTDFLNLCQVVGAEPWIVMPITLSNAEASNLIDYLAGSTTTVYGAKRAAAGHPAPWTSSFAKIHLEFGNEAWDTVFAGGNLPNSQAYGTRSQTVFSIMKENTWFSASSFDLIINGLGGYPPYNTGIQQYCNNNDSFAIAPYMMNTVDTFDTNEHLFGSTFAEAEEFVTNSGTAEGVANGDILQNQAILAATGSHAQLVTSEFNLSPRYGTITQAALNGYATSVGAGLAVADGMLQQLRAGVLTQNVFQLTQYDNDTTNNGAILYLWGVSVDYGVTNLRRPQYLAVQMANNAIGNSTAMLQTVQTGANPTWSQALVNTVQLNTAHYLQSFAFAGPNGSYSLIIINTHRSASLPVTFGGEYVPTGTVQMQQLTSANITDTNENSAVVVPVSSTLSNFNPSATFSLPPFSMTTLTWTSLTTPQIITFAAPASQKVGTPLTLTASASSGLPVSYSSSTTTICTVSGSTATFLAPGTCTITASQPGNASFSPAAPVSESFTVNAASVGFTISAPASITMQQGQYSTYPVTVTLAAGFSGTVTLSLSGLPTGASDTFQTTSTGANLAIALPAAVNVATYPLTLTGKSGATTVTTPISLVVSTASTPVTVDACAVDYGSCTIPQGTTATVYYGAQGKYLERVLTGTFVCSPATFGSDPDQGVQKSCYPIVGVLPPSAAACASDYGTCTVPPGAVAMVYYGAQSTHVYKALSGTFSCSPSTFGGDPLPGILKSCYPVVNQLPSGATACAVENGTCSTPAGSTANVYYGANGIYIAKTLSGGSFTCATATFGGVDPVVGVQKSCYPVISSPPSGVKACAKDGGSCTIPSGASKLVYYGADQIYLDKTLKGTFSCGVSTFGADPVPGVVKSCLY